LVLVGAAIGGWVYGFHWKNVASGDGFTREEKVIFQLQEQIEVLTKQNVDLTEALREARGEPEGEAVDKRIQGQPVSTMPLLQEQKVELPRR
jgi:hypothetical protein